MTRQAVSSTNIRAVGYDEPSRTLEVEFHGGRVYQFRNVPPSEHRTLVSSPSVGGYFARMIKGRYPGARVR